jgi:hypothetical protein
MQIHELTRRQLNEVDIVGPDGVLSKIGTAAKALVQPGGVKSALKTITPGFGQGALNTKDLATGDFAQRMQAVKNSAAIKQVAANLQKQWMQASKTLPAAQSAPATAATPPATTAPANQSPEEIRKARQAAAAKVAQGQMAGQPAAVTTPPATTAPAQTSTTSAPGYSSVKMNAPAGIPSVGGSKLPQPTVATQPTKAATAKPTTAPAAKSTEPMIVGTGQKPLDPKNPVDAALIAKIQAAQKKATPVVTQESVQLAEAASLSQLTDWYKKSVIPKSMAAASAKYLANPTIKTALQTILATADNPGEQVKAFQNLVAATSVESQLITAKNPKLAAATSTRGAPAATKTLSGGASAARAEISNAARISPAQIDEIAKLTGTLGRVQAADSNTIAYLAALGFKTS